MWGSNVGAARFELTTSWSQTRRDTGLRYAPKTLVGNSYQATSAPKAPTRNLATYPRKNSTPFTYRARSKIEAANIVLVLG